MPGRIVNDILNLLLKGIKDLGRITVDRVILGLGYTSVKLSTGNVGVCYSFQSEISTGCCQIHKQAGKLSGTSAIEMMNLARSWNIAESVIGIATVNALSSIYISDNAEAYQTLGGNVLDKLLLEKNDTVVFVGSIRPLIKRLEGKVDKIFVLERNVKRRGSGMLPDTACEEILPQANVSIITGTAIANGTLDHLIELSKGAREIAVVGASASVVPDPLFQRGVTSVSGIKVLDPDKLLQIVAEGGGTQQLKAAADFINLRPKSLS